VSSAQQRIHALAVVFTGPPVEPPFECEDHERRLFCSNLQTLLSNASARIGGLASKGEFDTGAVAKLLGKRGKRLVCQTVEEAANDRQDLESRYK
jgi:hypothetical protein